MSQVAILGRQKLPSALPGRTGKLDVWVLYQVDEDPNSTASVRVPEEEWTKAREQEAIRAALAERKLTTPERFQV